VNHKMALRPKILTDAAFHIAFEASILLQHTDINLYVSLTFKVTHKKAPTPSTADAYMLFIAWI